MSDMTIEDYLAQGGEVEDPNGVSHPYPPRS